MTIYDVENEHKMLTIDFLLLRTTTSLRRSLSERGPAAGGPNLGRPRQKAEAAQNFLYLSDLHMKKRQLLFQSGPQNGLLADISQYFALKKWQSGMKLLERK